ncbi:hypothetical protein [Salinibacterium sp.]|uniref:hypothetical protein n=1 Tax=Salinibacterium sp. TaxID=1915057 RepID=UPI00286CA082|nr:hypothetical protein [Salinibacterium sp.]
MNTPHDADPIRAARRARKTAVNKALTEPMQWYRDETAKLAITDLDDDAKAAATRAILMEMGQRMRRGKAKAKRDNAPGKVLMRIIRAEVERERSARDH